MFYKKKYCLDDLTYNTANEAGELVPVRFLFFKKVIFLKILGKSKWSTAWFHYISLALKLAYTRNKLFKAFHYWSRDMLNFNILDKGLRMVSPVHFVYDFDKNAPQVILY